MDAGNVLSHALDGRASDQVLEVEQLAAEIRREGKLVPPGGLGAVLSRFAAYWRLGLHVFVDVGDGPHGALAAFDAALEAWGAAGGDVDWWLEVRTHRADLDAGVVHGLAFRGDPLPPEPRCSCRAALPRVVHKARAASDDPKGRWRKGAWLSRDEWAAYRADRAAAPTSPRKRGDAA